MKAWQAVFNNCYLTSNILKVNCGGVLRCVAIWGHIHSMQKERFLIYSAILICYFLQAPKDYSYCVHGGFNTRVFLPWRCHHRCRHGIKPAINQSINQPINQSICPVHVPGQLQPVPGSSWGHWRVPTRDHGPPYPQGPQRPTNNLHHGVSLERVSHLGTLRVLKDQLTTYTKRFQKVLGWREESLMEEEGSFRVFLTKRSGSSVIRMHSIRNSLIANIWPRKSWQELPLHIQPLPSHSRSYGNLNPLNFLEGMHRSIAWVEAANYENEADYETYFTRLRELPRQVGSSFGLTCFWSYLCRYIPFKAYVVKFRHLNICYHFHEVLIH